MPSADLAPQTAQSARQASVRAATGTALSYEGDWLTLFDQAAIPAGMFNERLLRWINLRLSAAFTEINGAMQAFATAEGAYNFSSLGTFAASLVTSSLLMENGDVLLMETGDEILLEH